MYHPVRSKTLAARSLRLLGLSSLAMAMMTVAPARAQDGSPVGEVAAQKPFIMLLVDTSGSMEWTDEGWVGDNEPYPKGADGDHWKLRKPFEFGKSGGKFYGPCRLWEAACTSYSRPTWNWSDSFRSQHTQAERDGYSSMRSSGRRLLSHSRPRHVSLKESLTGSMLLAPSDYAGSLENLNPYTNGPGCWIVPRQRGSANNGSICLSDTGVEQGAFRLYPDHTDSQPHFQEVFDAQLPNGLMDTMGSNAIFGLAMLDSYQHSKKEPNGKDSVNKNWKGGAYGGVNIDDVMGSSFAGITEEDGEAGRNYNLGVFQMVVPASFEMSSQVAEDVSTFVQYALIDAGYLNTSSDEYQLDVSQNATIPATNIGMPASLRAYFPDNYQLGKQPIARATPLAAAMYDIQHFFARGSEGLTDGEGPVMKDRYAQCRAKQVVIITDGKPEPERLTGRTYGSGVAPMDDTLNAAFGYNPAQYPYSDTEDSIHFFVYDLMHDTKTARGNSYLVGSWNSASGEDYLKAANYDPRVHIVAITGQNAVSDEREIRKMAEMAREGLTCAGEYLDKSWIPQADGGDCNPNTSFCLDIRQRTYIGDSYDYIKRDGLTVKCHYPALILSTPPNPAAGATLVQRITDGLHLLFNDIISAGLSSRTRPTYVNYLDDPSQLRGGQFRYFSGVTNEAGKVFWRGQLYRQANLCDTSDPTKTNQVTDFSQQVNNLIEWDSANPDVWAQYTHDYRRVFTSFTQWSPSYFDDPNQTTGTAVYPGALSNRFTLGVGLQTVNAVGDQFGSGYLPHTPTGLKGSRIPFEFEAMKGLYETHVLPKAGAKGFFNYFNIEPTDMAVRGLIDEVRGRSPEKRGRALGAILNASPIAVEPPTLALPIDSYRAYQAQFANRPSMVYVATTDGLLHAMYAGELEGSNATQVIVQKTGAAGSMNAQREAWAYIPQMLHGKLAGFKGKVPMLLDGTPTVQDVRLCHQNTSTINYDVNPQACAYMSAGGTTSQDHTFQWRTVLVGGLGSVGAGYYALDVTRPGGSVARDSSDGKQSTYQVEKPDPIPLWEFSPEWERIQVAKFGDGPYKSLVKPSLNPPDMGACPVDLANFWKQSFMGASVGEAAIGTVVIKAKFEAASTDLLQRPVAVFSGGVARGDATNCEKLRQGRAIYVVDLQTGSLLRRFLTYQSPGTAGEKVFEHPVSGTPALFDGRPGNLVTRGFVGDAAGRLFRIDMTHEDPAQWSVGLFFDPADISGYADDTKFGPAAFKPALVKGSADLNNDLLVFYGLGEVGDLSTSDSKQLIIAVREKMEVTFDQDSSSTSFTSERVWHREFDSVNFSEKLTSAPVVFNGGVYFTTFVESTDDYCAPGWSRIYGLAYLGDIEPDDITLPRQPKGIFRTDDAAGPGEVKIPEGTACYPGATSTYCMAYEPEGAKDLKEPVIVRGLTVSLGQTCLAGVPGTDDPSLSVTQGNSSQTPTLMAQSTSDVFSGQGATSIGGGQNASGSGGDIFAIEQKLADPNTQYVPLSWAVVDN